MKQSAGILDNKSLGNVVSELCDEKSEAYKSGYKTIAEIGKERIRRAAAKIKEELSADDADKRRLKDKEEDLFENPEEEICG